VTECITDFEAMRAYDARARGTEGRQAARRSGIASTPRLPYMAEISTAQDPQAIEPLFNLALQRLSPEAPPPPPKHGIGEPTGRQKRVGLSPPLTDVPV
jgi:hypothetical protein